MKRLLTWSLLIVILISSSEIGASEFRSIAPIAQPNSTTWESDATLLRQESPDLENFARDARARVPELARKGIQRIFDAWNSGQIKDFLDTGMVDRDRFLDAMTGKVPRDAKVRVMSIESVQPLDESSKFEKGDLLKLLIKTRVSVRVKTQIEYNDPKEGFRRIEGVNEFLLRLQQIIPLSVEGSL